MIRVDSDRVGVGVPGGGSSGGSSAVFRGLSAKLGEKATRRWLRRRPGRHGESGPPRGRGEGAMRLSLGRRQVLNLGFPSRESIVGPRRQIVPEGSSRRERGASRPCNGPSGQGFRRDELSSPE